LKIELKNSSTIEHPARKFQVYCIPMAQRFLRRLAARGYRCSKLNKLFIKAFAYLKKPPAPATPTPAPGPLDDELDAHNYIHFIIPYHSQNPSSKDLQRLWRNTVFEPPGLRPVNEIPNDKDNFFLFRRMIVAYTRPLNLGNLLSYCKIVDWTGPPASSS
jgi:hypothetical protein